MREMDYRGSVNGEDGNGAYLVSDRTEALRGVGYSRKVPVLDNVNRMYSEGSVPVSVVGRGEYARTGFKGEYSQGGDNFILPPLSGAVKSGNIGKG